MKKEVKTAFAEDLRVLFNRLESLANRNANVAARTMVLYQIDTFRRALFLIGYGYNVDWDDDGAKVEIVKL